MSGTTRTAPSVTPPAPPPPPPVDDRIEISRITRGRARPTGQRREQIVWYLMRITGLALFVIALAHFSILHFIYDPADQTADFIANERWNKFFWRAIDWTLLMLVLFHAFLGMRVVLQDYFRGKRSRRIVLTGLYVIAVVLFIIGTWVVLSLPSPSGNPT